MAAFAHRAGKLLTPLRVQMAVGFAAKGASAAASFGLSWLIARQFGATGIGLYSIALTTATICSTLALVGLDYVTVRSVAQALKRAAPADARRAVLSALRVVVITAGLLAVALVLLREPIALRLLDQAAAAPFLGVMAAAIPALALTRIASAALRGSGQVVRSQIIDGPIATGLAMLVLAAAMLTGRAESALLPAMLYALFAGLAALLGWSWLMPALRRWKGAFGERPILFRSGVAILVITFTQLFVDWFALLLLAAQGDAAEAGLFRVAFQIVSVLNLLNVASDSILAPVIAQEHAGGDHRRISRVVSRTSALLVAAGSPLLLVCLLVPEWILGLFGPEFTAAAWPLRILALGQLVSLAMGPIGGILVMTHHEKWSLAYGIVAAAGATALCLWLIPAMGLMGAAIAVTAATVFRRLAAALIVRFVVGIELWRWSGSAAGPDKD